MTKKSDPKPDLNIDETPPFNANRAQLFKMVKGLQGLLESKREASQTGSDVAEQRKLGDLRSTVTETEQSVLDKGISDLKSKMVSELSSFADSFADQSEKLRGLDRLICDAEERLQSCYGIEAQADTLAALADVIETTKAGFENDKKAREDALEVYIKERSSVAAKQHEEWLYSKAREKIKTEDALTDNLAKLKTQHETGLKEREDALLAREALAAELSKENKELEAEIDSLKESHAKELSSATAAAAASATKTAEASWMEQRKDLEIQPAILNARLESMEAENEHLGRENERLRTEVAALSTKMQEVALRSVDSSNVSQAAMFGGLQGAISSQQPQGGGKNSQRGN